MGCCGCTADRRRQRLLVARQRLERSRIGSKRTENSRIRLERLHRLAVAGKLLEGGRTVRHLRIACSFRRRIAERVGVVCEVAER